VVNNISPRVAYRYLRDVTDTRSQFHTSDGSILKNLIDLTCYLSNCDKDVFGYHVSHQHNHFASWVENVILDNHLATQMSLVLDKNPMRLMVTKRINELVHHATREPSSREKAGMVLEDALLPEEHFLTNDGRTVRNLWELKEFIHAAKEHVIAYHVSPAKNDFSDWSGGVLLDMERADKIVASDGKEDMVRHLDERLSGLEAFKAHKPRVPNLSEHIDSIRKRL